jgi:hypothetical protein
MDMHQRRKEEATRTVLGRACSLWERITAFGCCFLGSL